MTDWFEIAVREIKNSYGDIVKVDRKSIHKFGRGTAMPNSETEINSLNKNETYLSSNLINTVVSTSTADTQDIKYEGMRTVGGVYSFYGSTAFALQGTTPVTLPQAVIQ